MSIEMTRPIQIEDWKNEFLSKFGNEGAIVKGVKIPQSFDVVGNPKFEEWQNTSIQGKKASIDKEKQQGFKRFD